MLNVRNPLTRENLAIDVDVGQFQAWVRMSCCHTTFGVIVINGTPHGNAFLDGKEPVVVLATAPHLSAQRHRHPTAAAIAAEHPIRPAHLGSQSSAASSSGNNPKTLTPSRRAA